MDRGRLGRLWWSDWRAGLRIDLFLIVVLAAGAILFGISRAWSAGQAGLGDSSVNPVAVGADVAVVAPLWMSQLTRPAFSPEAVAAAAERGGIAHAAQTALRATIQSPWGDVQAWGFSTLTGWTAVVTAGGSTWRGQGDLLVPAAWLADGAARVGQPVQLFYLDPSTGERRSLALPVTGAFAHNEAVIAGPVLDFADLAKLTGATGPDAVFLWATPTFASLDGQSMAAAVEPLLPSARAPLTAGAGYLPYVLDVHPDVLARGSAAARVQATIAGSNQGLGVAVFLMFIGLFVAASVAQIIRALDQQERLGVYKAVGLEPSHVLWLNTASVALDVLLATVLGAAVLLAAGGSLTRLLGVPLLPDAGTVFIWAAFGLILARWGGRVAASLFEQADVMALLRRRSQAFDWWALIRF
ncbi:MAG TPA: hypothetical protein VNM16_06180 [Bacillota bacterium]|nr:hypothetical protein [Bacillota bacterium]